MIRLNNVSKRYPTGNEVLSGVTLEIDRGEMVFLTGHSGAGKSTLLKLITMIERPTRGQIVIDGQNITHLPRRRVPAFRRKIGIIFQDHRLLYDRNLYENVSLPLVIAGCSRREIGRRTRAALDKVGLLHKEKVMPVTLSGGEQQRAGIARAVINKPPVLLADEPTGNLDPELSEEIMRVFLDFSHVGVTVLVASHDVALIARMDKPIYRLEQGRLLRPDVRYPEPSSRAARV